MRLGRLPLAQTKLISPEEHTMRRVTVWAFEAIPELDGQTGFVPVQQDLAAELIAAGKVQDPRVGGVSLKCRRISGMVGSYEYATKELTPAGKGKKKAKE